MTEIEQRLHQLAANRTQIAFLSISISVAVLIGLWFDRSPPGAIALVWLSFATIIVRAIVWVTPDEIAPVTATMMPANQSVIGTPKCCAFWCPPQRSGARHLLR